MRVWQMSRFNHFYDVVRGWNTFFRPLQWTGWGNTDWKGALETIIATSTSQDLPRSSLRAHVLPLMTTCPSATWRTARFTDYGRQPRIMRSHSSNGNRTRVSVFVDKRRNSPHFYIERPGSSFRMSAEDRILAKRTSVTSEEEKPVCVVSLAWIRGGTHLLVSFLNHHAQYVRALPRFSVSNRL